VGTRDIDGYVWLTDDAISTHTVTWSGRERADSRERSWLGEVLNRVLLQQQLSKTGMASNQAYLLLQPIKVDSVRIERGREVKSNGTGRFLEIIVMVMLIYMAVLLYGISVMRSVLEEKNSRIMEVLLSSAGSTELMTGKLLGVGAVGLTQIVVWTLMAGVVALPALAARASFGELQISPVVMISFVLFFLLGYLLYSTMYATIGAITTTEQEGQQVQFIIVIPLVLSVFMLMPVIRTPDSAAVVWMSLIPFFAPIVMFARIVVHPPAVGDRLVTAIADWDGSGPHRAFCANLQNWCADLWEKSHAAGNPEVAEVREGLEKPTAPVGLKHADVLVGGPVIEKQS
jgi:ABC-2 type transport system permease protein